MDKINFTLENAGIIHCGTSYIIIVCLVIAIIFNLLRFVFVIVFINYCIFSDKNKNKNELTTLICKAVKLLVVTSLMKHHDPIVVQQLSLILHMIDLSIDDVLYNFLPSDKTAQIIVVAGATIIFAVLLIIVFTSIGPIPIDDAAPTILPIDWAGADASVDDALVDIEDIFIVIEKANVAVE